MKTMWTDTRPNGQPIEPGTVCFVSDLEDGTHPQYTYGKDQAEVLQKLALNNMHAQATLARRTAPAAQPGTPAPAAAIPARMTAGEVMEATSQLTDPARAGDAAARLIKDATGFDPARAAMDSFMRLAQEWEEETPDFLQHAGNRKLMAQAVGRKVGGRVGLITKQMLDETFAELTAREELFVAQPVTPPAPHTNNLETFPGENQVRSVERPRGARFATGIPARRLSSPQIAQPKTLKYTKEQIDSMPLSASKRLIENDDKDYALACATYYPEPSAVMA